MSTLTALAKISLAAVSVTGVGTASAFSIKNILTTHLDQKPTELSVVLVKTQPAQPPQTASQLSVSGADQYYKCRLKDGNPKDTPSICKLVELTIPHKWIDLAGIKQATESTTLSLENLKDATKQFKLEVSEELFNKITPTSTKIVEIVSTTASPVVHAELTTLFKVDGTTVDYDNVSTLLGRAVREYPSIDGTKQKQCLLTDGTDFFQPHNCTFRSFGSSTASSSVPHYSNQTIINFEALAPTTFTTNKYYLLDYAKPLAKTDLYKSYVNENARTGNSYQVTLDSVFPVIFNGSGEHKTAFILSETQSFNGVIVKALQ